ncbi:hypothetical protein QQ045_008566 [Rhodiola kirilowii]
MLTRTFPATTAAAPILLRSKFPPSLSAHRNRKPLSFPTTTRSVSLHASPMNWLSKLGLRAAAKATDPTSSAIAQAPDEDIPAPGKDFAQFGAGCFWGVELAYQRVPGVTKTEVGYTQGLVDKPSLMIFLWQGNDVGTQYRSGIYYYTPEQEKAARESLERHQTKLNKKIVTEILPAKKFYRAEEYHQQYLAKGGRAGFGQSAEKGCKDPIRCYG